jgi:fructose-1,6-bisphosphatase
MKKLITLCLFAFVMILGTQSSFAQSIIETNALASEKTQELKKVVKFNSDTEDMVYKTYQEFVQAQASLDKINASGGTVSAEEQKKVDMLLNEKFKSIFTQEEFIRYSEFVEKHQ